MNIKRQAKRDAKMSVTELGWTLTDQWLMGFLGEVRDRIRAQDADRAATLGALVTRNIVELRGVAEGNTFADYLKDGQ